MGVIGNRLFFMENHIRCWEVMLTKKWNEHADINIIQNMTKTKGPAAKKKEDLATAIPASPTQEELLTQIRDLLKK